MHRALFRIPAAPVLASVLAFLPAVASADRLVLKNGDTLTGKVLSKSGDTIKFATDYAGELNIRWSNVATLTTEKPVAVMLDDQSYRNTALAAAESGHAKLEGTRRAPDADPPSVGLGNILYINPSPEESGRGYRLSARANLAFTENRGNANNAQLHADAEMQVRTRPNRFILGMEGNRASAENTRTVFNGRGYTSYDWFIKPKEFLYARASIENDRFRDIRRRNVIGGGYGFQVFEDERTKLSVRGGPDWVEENRYVGRSEDFFALGWNINFTHKLNILPVELFLVQDGFRGFNSTGDIQLKTRTGLRIPLRQGLTVNAQFNHNWENNPSPGRKSSDTQLIFGLGYSYN